VIEQNIKKSVNEREGSKCEKKTFLFLFAAAYLTNFMIIMSK